LTTKLYTIIYFIQVIIKDGADDIVSDKGPFAENSFDFIKFSLTDITVPLLFPKKPQAESILNGCQQKRHREVAHISNTLYRF
jgi:hypothetical protein